MTQRRAALTRFVVLTVLAASAGARTMHAQGAQTSTAKQLTATERALFKLESDWAQGVVKRDAATIRRMTAPRWIYSDESGTMNREQSVR